MIRRISLLAQVMMTFSFAMSGQAADKPQNSVETDTREFQNVVGLKESGNTVRFGYTHP